MAQQQFGMQMPGGRARRGPALDVYTGLLLLAVIALGMGVAVAYTQGSKIGKDGSAMGVYGPDDPVQLQTTP